MFVVIIAAGVTFIISKQLYFFRDVWIMLPVLVLYGLAALLQGYVVSHFVVGPLKSFIITVGISILMYAIAAIGFGVR